MTVIVVGPASEVESETNVNLVDIKDYLGGARSSLLNSLGYEIEEDKVRPVVTGESDCTMSCPCKFVGRVVTLC